MFEVREKPLLVERALLVRLYFDPREEEESDALLEELGELVSTLGIGVVEKVLARSREMHRKFLCGTGKAAEIVELAKAHECDCIVIDNQLAPSQQREWEKAADMCVIDREEVILDIFAKRAQTKEARLQVELARMQYALPRMARMWGHLDREGGSGGSQGGGAARGMGEKQIEVDRRMAHVRIDRARRELDDVRKQRATQRKEREKMETPHAAIVGYTNSGKSTLLNILSGADVMAKDMLFATLDTTTRKIEVDRRMAHVRIDRARRELDDVRKQRATQRKEREKMETPHAAIVGYTNSGKSTLLNQLSGSDVMAKDMLFATLDTTTRKIELPDGQPLLITDTVGFVRNLPHRLVEAFKATLEEAVLADFLIHVLDATSPEIDRFHETTLKVLGELGAVDKPTITVLNKIDRVTDPERLADLRHRYPDALNISAVTGFGLEALLQKCSEVMADRVRRRRYRIPQSRADLLGMLHRDAKVLSTDYEENDILVTAVVPAAIDGRLELFAC